MISVRTRLLAASAVLVALLAAFAAPLPYAAAQPPADAAQPAVVGGGLDLGLSGAIGGEYLDLKVAGGLAYVLQGRTLLVMDLHNPLQPWLCGSLVLPDLPHRLELAGDIAYLTDNYGLRVLDLHDPAQPRVLASQALPETWGPLIWNEGYLYVGSRAFDGVLIFDVRDSARPVQIRQLSLGRSDFASGIRAGNWIVLSTWTTPFAVYVLDSADPAAPTLRSKLELPDLVRDIVVSGDVAYLATSDGLRLLDLSPPGAPQTLSLLPQPYGLTGVALVGTLAYASFNLSTESRYIWVVDVADPTRPAELRAVTVPGLRGVPARMLGQTAVVLVHDLTFAGVQLLDLRDLSKPALSGSLPLVAEVGRVRARDGLVFAQPWSGPSNPSYSGVWLIDVRDPQRPALRAPVGLPAWPRNIAIGPSYAYVVYDARTRPTRSVVQAIDTRDPGRPVLRSTVILTGTISGLQLVDQTLLALNNTTLYSVDVSDADRLSLSGSAAVSGRADVLTAAGVYAYVVGDNLSVFAVSSTGQLTLMGSAPAWGQRSPAQEVVRIAVEGSRVYTMRSIFSSTAYGTFMQAFDVSAPASPQRLGDTGNISLPIDYLSDLGVRNGLLLVLAGQHLHLVDASTPQSIKIVRSYRQTTYFAGFEQVGPQVYFGGEYVGLQTALLLEEHVWLPQVRVSR